jgi:DNA-binding LacI/PurR family transcriptional regulator/DNA-binding transcriptional regulator YhcF (GntR family)
MRLNRNSAHDVAWSYLQMKVSDALRSGETRLPAIRTMAHDAGVSLVTMWKSVQRLKEAGTIRSAQRGGLIFTYSISSDSSRVDSPDANALWQRTAVRIKGDILNRAIAPGMKIPSCKELQRRYSISHPTLRKALRSLEKQGIINSCGRGYQIPRLRQASNAKRIVLMTARQPARYASTNELSLGFLGPTHLRQLELECTEAGILLDTYYYFPKSDSLIFCSTQDNLPTTLINDENTLGYIWLITGVETTLDIDVDQIADLLSSFRKPLAVLAETSEATPLGRLLKTQKTKVFCITFNSKPAEAVARYLLDLNHRRVAYISPYHSNSWSQARLAGLQSTFRTAGIAQGVTAFLLHECSSSAEYLRFGSLHGGRESLQARIEEWRREAPDFFVTKITERLDQTLQQAFMQRETERQLYPFFERALADHEITAWVTANDFVACMAQEFLLHKKVRIPREISIISFDDSIEATIHQITSYDFNVSACISAMLSHILDLRSSTRTLVEMDGWIVSRRSTGISPRYRDP